MMDSLLLYKILKNRTGAEISASGNPATLPGTLKNNPMNEMKVFGWSKQERTTGAQLFPTITPSIEEKNGITVEYMEHGKIHISGTSEKTVDFMTPTFELLAGTYTLSMGVNIDNTLMRCTLSTTEGLPYFDILNNEASKTETTEDNKILYLLLRVYGGKTIDITIQPMLNTGTSPLPWEPYTGGKPSPSPEYPQKIVSAGTESTNLFDKDSIFVNYVIEVDGKLVWSIGYDSSDFIPVSSGTYTITATGSVRCKTYDKDKKPFTINTYTDININNGGTFEIAKNVKYIRFSMYHPNVDTIMLNRGSTALPYEAYKSGMIDVTVHGKNLFDLEYATDINNWKSGGYSYIPYYVGKGNKVSVSYSEKLPLGSGFYAAIGLDKGNVQQTYGWLYHSGADIGKTQFTFTAEEDYIYLNVVGNNIVQSIKELKKLQIEVSSAPTTYEPYRTPQSLSINTQTGLPAIPVDSDGNYTDANGQQWISDYVDLKRGKYVQRVWQKTFDGSESWGTYISTGYYLANILPEKMSNRGMLCDQLRRSDGGIASDVIIVGAFNANTSLYIENSTLRDNTLADKGLSNWKAHLAEHPLTVMTYLNTTIERNLTPEEIQAYKNLVTYAGTTIVENDAECYMEVSAGGGDSLRAKKLALILGD